MAFEGPRSLLFGEKNDGQLMGLLGGFNELLWGKLLGHV